MTDSSPIRGAEDHAGPVAFQQHHITESTRAHSTMADFHYADQFVLATNVRDTGPAGQAGPVSRWLCWTAFSRGHPPAPRAGYVRHVL